jgi:tripartite-type tricarboxylate transporter receptor subunit TctC
MKTIIAAIILLATTLVAQAKDIQVLWPFSVSSEQANMVRMLIQNANKNQSKYNFIFASKQGAGGSIAAQAALSNEVSILATSSSFYIRPLLYKESHDITKFSMTNLLCIDQPLVIYSSKQNMSLVGKENFSLGVIPGSITTLVARLITENNKNISILEVPYRGTPEATLEMLGGHIDGSVDFLSKSSVEKFGRQTQAIGITGRKSIANMRTFNEQGIFGVEEITNSYYLFVNGNYDEKFKIEISEIFYNALDSQVKSLCEKDYGTVLRASYKSLEKINTDTYRSWTRATRNVPRN